MTPSSEPKTEPAHDRLHWTETIELLAEPRRVAPVRHRIVELSQSLGFTADVAHDIGVAVSEALSNAVEHARPDNPDPVVNVVVTADADGIAITVLDHGLVHWDPNQVAPGGFENINDPGLLSPRGRGLIFMRAVMDDVSIEVRASGTRVDLYKRRMRVAPANG